VGVDICDVYFDEGVLFSKQIYVGLLLHSITTLNLFDDIEDVMVLDAQQLVLILEGV
jgi:hypothetical protein